MCFGCRVSGVTSGKDVDGQTDSFIYILIIIIIIIMIIQYVLGLTAG